MMDLNGTESNSAVVILLIRDSDTTAQILSRNRLCCQVHSLIVSVPVDRFYYRTYK